MTALLARDYCRFFFKNSIVRSHASFAASVDALDILAADVLPLLDRR